MDLHEYQAKERFRAAGIPVPPGEVATTAAEVEKIAEKYGGAVVVKAQVHSGGRGKAGGVKLAKDAAEAKKHAENILGMDIKGFTVEKVLVTPAEDIATEAYVGVLVDRAKQAPIFIVSPAGGIDIETVAKETPDEVRYLTVDPRYGLLPHQALWLANFLYDDPELIKQASSIVARLYDAFRESGASMAEINPLITTPDGTVKAIDAKM
ncbi:MAG TPA: ATP-grasp domain-containing protein, partial [Longimicrobiales bacterium]|nr:ATP-grasp domain-containing protein [Longimicrobiales bacterium]